MIQSQPDEIERIACSGCGSFLRLERSIPERVGHPRYDMMRCIGCESIQCIADDSLSAGAYFTGRTNANPVESEHQRLGFLTTEANDVVGAIHPKAMPVILTQPEEIETWMTAPAEEALKLQRPLPNGAL